MFGCFYFIYKLIRATVIYKKYNFIKERKVAYVNK